MVENRLLEYAEDLRSDLRYAFETGEGQTPNAKDVPVMNWLIKQATKLSELKAEADLLLFQRDIKIEQQRKEIEELKAEVKDQTAWADTYAENYHVYKEQTKRYEDKLKQINAHCIHCDADERAIQPYEILDILKEE